MEISIKKFQDTYKGSIIQTSFMIPWHLPKRSDIFLQSYILIIFYTCLIHNNQKTETT